MTSVVTIYLLIGLAHWAAHLLQCDVCRRTIRMNIDLVLDGTVKTFGWPIQAIAYVNDMRKPRKPLPSMKDLGFVEVSIKPGESAAEFRKRIEDTILNHVRQGMSKTEEKPGPNPGDSSSNGFMMKDAATGLVVAVCKCGNKFWSDEKTKICNACRPTTANFNGA